MSSLPPTRMGTRPATPEGTGRDGTDGTRGRGSRRRARETRARAPRVPGGARCTGPSCHLAARKGGGAEACVGG